jgi:two-component system NarL family sensor kinase
MPSSSEELRIAIITTTLIVLFLVAFILFLVIIFQVRKKKAKAQLEKEILNAQIEIQEQTLKTISQEIHDNIGQILSLAKLNLNTFPVNPDEKTQLKLNDTKQLVGKAINDLRNVSRGMHGDKIAELGLQEAISNELKILQNSGQYNTSLHVAGHPFKLKTQEEMVLFRMVQEALHNSIKHAKAKNICVTLTNNENKYILMIADDGIGFDKETLQSTQTGIGLKNMQNRAALINGIFSINSAPVNGTIIEIILNR